MDLGRKKLYFCDHGTHDASKSDFSDPANNPSTSLKNMKIKDEDTESNKENAPAGMKFIMQKVTETQTFEDEDGFLVTKPVQVMKKVAVAIKAKSQKTFPENKKRSKSSQNEDSDEYENVKINNQPKEKPKAKPKKKAMAGQQSISSFFKKK